jgi:hypothetical protein
MLLLGYVKNRFSFATDLNKHYLFRSEAFINNILNIQSAHQRKPVAFKKLMLFKEIVSGYSLEQNKTHKYTLCANCRVYEC